MRACVCSDSLRLLHFPFSADHLLSYHPVLPTSSSRMWWTNSLCTPANEDLGTLAECDPLAGYEPNDYHIMEATEPCIQESSVENGSRMTSSTMTSPSARRSLLHCSPRSEKTNRAVVAHAILWIHGRRRRAYHSQEEGLSSSLSSSVSHDRTGGPVVKPFDLQISCSRNSEPQLRK